VQLELITQQSMRAGFTGGLVVDFPNSTKAKKYVLYYFCTYAHAITIHTYVLLLLLPPLPLPLPLLLFSAFV